MYRRTMILSWIACMLMSGCAAQAERKVKAAGSSLTLLQATDLHYLSPSLCDNGTLFQKTMANGDGKMTEDSKQILDTLTAKVITKHPDAFCLTGDITFNGEKQSLQEVKTAFEKIEDAGIPVLVIPGNHDISYPFAYQYEGDQAVLTANISQQDFKEMMKEFGYADGIAKDEDSFSYVYPLSSDTWLLAMDANTEEDSGAVAPETLSWMEEQLKKAQEQNIKVITMSHQNVLPQSQLMSQGFVIENHEEVSALLKKYDVSLNLSGHSHLEHTAVEEGLQDVCTESLSIYPLQYSRVELAADHSFTCSRESLGILREESWQRFDSLMRGKLSAELTNPDLSEEDKQTMLDFALQVNLKYFTGDTSDISFYFDQKGWKLWKTYGAQSFWIGYLESIKEAF